MTPEPKCGFRLFDECNGTDCPCECVDKMYRPTNAIDLPAYQFLTPRDCWVIKWVLIAGVALALALNVVPGSANRAATVVAETGQ